MKTVFPDNCSQAFWFSFVLCFIIGLIIIYPLACITGLSKSFGGLGNDGYIEIARNLSAGNGYVFEQGGEKVFHRPPLYPFFLIPTVLMPDSLERPFLILSQSFIAGWICYLLFFVAQRLFDKKIAKIALGLFLCNPWLYWHIKNPMTAIMQCFFYMLLVYASMMIINYINRKDDSLRLKPYIYYGFAGAGLTLTHAAMLPVFILYCILIFVCICCKKQFFALKYFILSAVVAIICILPWTIRNKLLTNSFIPVSSGGGLAYFNGSVHWQGIEDVPQQKGESYIDASLRIIGLNGREYDLTHFKGFKDVRLNSLANKKMIEDIVHNPAGFMKKFILNAIEYYFPVFVYKFRAAPNFTKEELLFTCFHLILWLLAIAGICLKRNDKKAENFLLLCIIFIYAVWYFPFATGFIGHNLYTFGTMPFVCILSAAGIVALLQKSSIFNSQLSV